MDDIKHPSSPRNRIPLRVKEDNLEIDPNLVSSSINFVDFLERIENNKTSASPKKSAEIEVPKDMSEPWVIPDTSPRKRYREPDPEEVVDPEPKKFAYESVAPDPSETVSPRHIIAEEAERPKRALEEEEPENPKRAREEEYGRPKRAREDETIDEYDSKREKETRYTFFSPKRSERRQMRVPQPTQVYVSQAHSVEYDGPDYGAMDRDSRMHVLADMKMTAKELKEKHSYLPPIDIRNSINPMYLRSLYTTIEKYTEVTHTRNWADRWKAGLILLFCGIETIGTQVLGLDIGQFALMTYSSKLMHLYDDPLMRMGKRTKGVVGTGGEGWHPMLLMAAYTTFNILALVAVRAIASSVGGGSDGIHKMLGFVIELLMGKQGTSSIRVAPPSAYNGKPSSGQNTHVPRPAERANTNYHGIDIGNMASFATAMASENARARNNEESEDNIFTRQAKSQRAEGLAPSERIFHFA